MFQVEPIMWLQSFESPFMTWFMTSVSWLGYSIIYGFLISIISFGINLKKGLAIFMILSIGGIMTYGLKNGLQFPRPSDIDIRVIEPGQEPSGRLVDYGSASSFWSIPSDEAMDAVKNKNNWSYGLPSGHVSAAVAFFLGAFFFFRKKWLLIFSVCWILLMALSRMYLGRHFLGDVIGGLIVGVIAVLITAFLIRSFEVNSYKVLKPKSFIPLLIFTAPLVLLTPFIILLDADNIGRLLGLIAIFFTINKLGHTNDSGKLTSRIIRIFIALIVSAIIFYTIKQFMETIGWEDTQVSDLITTILITFLPFVSSFYVLKRLKYYQI